MIPQDKRTPLKKEYDKAWLELFKAKQGLIMVADADNEWDTIMRRIRAREWQKNQIPALEEKLQELKAKLDAEQRNYK